MKTLTKTRKWRHIYKYRCAKCGKSRLAFKFRRYQDKTCTLCEVKPQNNQQKLF